MRVRRGVVSASLAAALIVATLTGCGARNAADEQASVGVTSSEAPQRDISEGYSGAEPGVAPAPDSPGTDGAATADRLVIRTQTMRLEVESTPEAVESIRGLASRHSAVITDLQVATETDEWLYRYDEYGYSVGDGAALRGWVTVRVPADELDAFVEGAMALGTVKFQSEGTEDVTQQHVDLSARLENLRAEELRLRTFFDAAKNVQEMLAVEVELNRVRGEIESLDAQVKYLERQAAMATVTIELTEERPVVRPDGDDWGFRDAITDGVRGAASVLTFAIAFIIATAPLWLLGLVVFFVVRLIVRKRRAKRVVDVPPGTPTASGPDV